MLTFKYFYIMADDLNLRWKTILSLYNTYPFGNIIVSFWHQEDIYVSLTLHISEFVIYNENMYSLPKLSAMNQIHNSLQKIFL